MTNHGVLKFDLRRLLPLLLLTLLLAAMMPMGSFAADETLYGYRVNYNNNQTQITNNIGWYNANLGNGWAEGDWVPYQLVITGLNGINDLDRIAVVYDFYKSQNDAILVDLVRGFQIRHTSNAGQNIMLTDSQMGYPSSQSSPIVTVDDMEDAQTSSTVGLWTGFQAIHIPKEQINVGFNGTTFVPLQPTAEKAHFYITKQQLIDFGIPNDVKSIVLYFQLHLARTSLWSSGLFQNYGDIGVPAENWGGHIYKSGSVFDGVRNNGSFYYPGSSGHAALIGATRTVPIPVPSQNLGSVTGFKWHDLNGNGLKEVNEPYLADWPIFITADIEGMSFVLSTKTNASGQYSFPTLTYGDRYITEGKTRDSETGWTQTHPSSGFDVLQPFGGFDNYNDYLNDIDEGEGVDLARYGYKININRNNYTFTNMNFGNRMTGEFKITKVFDFEGVEGFDPETMLPESILVKVTGPSHPAGKVFELMINALGEGELIIKDLIPGEYKVEELDFEDSDLWESKINGSPVTVASGANPGLKVEITNTFKPGELKITKVFDFEDVEGFDKATMLPSKISVEVTGPSYPLGKEFEMLIDADGKGELHLKDLIPGDYTVDELDFTGSGMWDSDIDPESVKVEAGALEVVKVEITNTFKPGELKITKVFDFKDVEGFDKATMLPLKISVEVTGPSYPLGKEFEMLIDADGKGELHLKDLIPGDYTVDELDFTGSGMWDSDIDPESVKVEAGALEVVKVEITNTFKSGELKITKNFVGGMSGMYPEFIEVKVIGPSFPGPDGKIFKINIDPVTGSGEIVLDKLIPGSYSVSELAFAGSDVWSSSVSGSPANVAAGAQTIVTITNTMEYREETAWAFGNNKNMDFVNSKNWGWNIGPITEGYHEVHLLYAGAANNDISKGTLVGEVHIHYTDGKVHVMYHMYEGFTLVETHVWIGKTPLPTQRNGRMTDAPGAFPYKDGAMVEMSGPVYVAAHAVVRMPGQ